MKDYIKQLEKENQELKVELQQIKTNSAQKQKAKRGFIKFIGLTFAGRKLKKSIYKVLDQYNRDRFVTREAISDLLASIVYRFTRIGLFTLIFALLPFILLIQQNILLKQQNQKIQDQNFLSEASRRSTQMFIMGDVLSDMNQERKISNKLSSTLTGRIASLSIAMKPYYYYENGKLINSPMSPERGQLLLTVCSSNLDKEQLSDAIFQNSDFSYAELENVILRSAHLKDINLAHSNLVNANLEGTNLQSASLAYTNLKHAELVDADLRFVNFSHADLRTANLTNTKIDKANFTKTIMDSTKVGRIDWLNYIKNDLKLKGATYLNKNYKVDSIFDKISGKKVPTLLRK